MRKMKIIDEDTNETMWLSEHSTAAHIDNSRWNFTCSREVSYFRITDTKWYEKS